MGNDISGETKPILFDEIADLHFRYLKGFPEPYSVVTSERDEWIKESYDGEPISEEEYNRGVEELPDAVIAGERLRWVYPLDAPNAIPHTKRKVKALSITTEYMCYAKRDVPSYTNHFLIPLA